MGRQNFNILLYHVKNIADLLLREVVVVLTVGNSISIVYEKTGWNEVNNNFHN